MARQGVHDVRSGVGIRHPTGPACDAATVSLRRFRPRRWQLLGPRMRRRQRRLRGELSLGDLAGLATAAEPELISGEQELFESIINRHIR